MQLFCSLESHRLKDSSYDRNKFVKNHDTLQSFGKLEKFLDQIAAI